jgi:hypothetical protein
MDSEWSWSMGYLYEPWNRNGVESDGFGEETQCRREQAAALSLAYFVGGEFPMLRGWKRSRTTMGGRNLGLWGYRLCVLEDSNTWGEFSFRFKPIN